MFSHLQFYQTLLHLLLGVNVVSREAVHLLLHQLALQQELQHRGVTNPYGCGVLEQEI